MKFCGLAFHVAAGAMPVTGAAIATGGIFAATPKSRSFVVLLSQLCAHDIVFK